MIGGFEHTGVAKLNGAALYVPSGPTVEIKTMGSGAIAVPTKSCSSCRPRFSVSTFILFPPISFIGTPKKLMHGDILSALYNNLGRLMNSKSHILSSLGEARGRESRKG